MKIAAFLALFACLTASIGVSQTESRESRELKMADQAVLASIAVAETPKGRTLCTTNELACTGPDKAELGVALIGARHTSASRLALINLLSYRLDGSVAEDHTCYVLNTGSTILPQLRNANADSLSARCVAELHKLTRGRQSSFEGLNETAVCSDATTIKRKIADLTDAVKSGKKCGPEDF